MEKYQNLINFLESWNVISNYKFTWELVNKSVYIRNTVTHEGLTKLYGMLHAMAAEYIVYIREDRDTYDLSLEVQAI